MAERKKAPEGKKLKPKENHPEPGIPPPELTTKSEHPKSKTEELPTENRQLPTEKMEVHHHPQLEHKPKPWKEYLLEGLMIFVAVVMGFIAENVREYIAEHKRAAEFAASYYQDIKKDTTQVNMALRFNKHKIAAIDSLLTALHQPPSLHNDTIISYKSMVATAVLPFEPSSGNYDQIKALGSVRNFKQKMISLMNEYDLQARQVIRREEITQKFITEQNIPFALTTFNFENSYDIITTGKISHKMYFDRSPEANRRFTNIVIFDQVLSFRTMQEYKKLLKVADRVVAELKKEYDLEDE